MGGVFLSRHGEKRRRIRFGYNRNMESVLVEKNISFAKISSPYEIIMGLFEYASQRKKENTITRCRASSAQRSLDHWGRAMFLLVPCLLHKVSRMFGYSCSGEAIRLNLNLGPTQLGVFMISSGGDCRLDDLYLKLLTYVQSTHISTGILRRLYKFTLLLSPNYFFLLPSPPSPPSIFPMAEALPSTAPTALRPSIVSARTMWKGYYWSK